MRTLKKPCVFEVQRRAHGKSQNQIARRLGVCKSTVSKFERGITSPPASEVVNWAREYGMTIDHFIEAARNLRYDKEAEQ